MFPYFHMFGKNIGTYGLCAVLGLVCCGWVACLLAKRLAVGYEDVILIMVVVGVSLVMGGHFLYGITNAKILFELFAKASFLTIGQFVACLGLCFGGMVFYGGFLGACIGLLIYTRFSKSVERRIAFDLFAVCIPLFHMFGRIGCFLSGCCYGTESKFGFVIHGNTLVPEVNDVRRLPVPLIEGACNLVIFLVLLRLFHKGKEKGKMIFYYMLMYPAVRFVLEFFRGDAIRGFLFGLSTSQWISIGLLAVAVWKLFISKSKGKRAVVCAGMLLAMTLAIGGMAPATVAHATETVEQETVATNEAETEEAVADEADNVKTEDASDTTQTGESVLTTGTTGTETAEEEPPFNTKEIFVIFTCCLFSVALCVVIGLYGNPNDRLKDKYKRARKQQQLQEKKKKEAEERAVKKAAADAKYAEELAQYEADVKAYEEAKAAKSAAKAAKKAEKEAKKK